MRMWMCNPKIMCVRHLIGEYRELFTFVGCINKGRSIDGFIKNDLLEPKSVQSRYIELRNEMLSRGYKPKAELKTLDFSKIPEKFHDYKVNKENHYNELVRRCPECSRRANACIS